MLLQERQETTSAKCARVHSEACIATAALPADVVQVVQCKTFWFIRRFMVLLLNFGFDNGMRVDLSGEK